MDLQENDCIVDGVCNHGMITHRSSSPSPSSLSIAIHQPPSSPTAGPMAAFTSLNGLTADSADTLVTNVYLDDDDEGFGDEREDLLGVDNQSQWTFGPSSWNNKVNGNSSRERLTQRN